MSTALLKKVLLKRTWSCIPQRKCLTATIDEDHRLGISSLILKLAIGCLAGCGMQEIPEMASMTLIRRHRLSMRVTICCDSLAATRHQYLFQNAFAAVEASGTSHSRLGVNFISMTSSPVYFRSSVMLEPRGVAQRFPSGPHLSWDECRNAASLRTLST